MTEYCDIEFTLKGNALLQEFQSTCMVLLINVMVLIPF